MIVEETFYRPTELMHEARTMPAETYNLAHLLLSRATTGSVFVPIRAMQYLAVLDREEFIFIDREGGRNIEIAWRRIQPGARESLDAPVGYEAVYYAPSAADTMKRLQGEFQKALRALQGRELPGTAARIIPLERPRP
jgi:hypothetical protein